MVRNSALQLLLATAQMVVALIQAAALLQEVTPSRAAAPAKAPVPTQAATIRATQDRTAAARTMNCRRGNYPPCETHKEFKFNL